jgi:hypothetical protein
MVHQQLNLIGHSIKILNLFQSVGHLAPKSLKSITVAFKSIKTITHK